MKTASAILSIFLLLSTLSRHTSVAEKVVLFSVPHTANVRTHGNIARALAAYGHEVYVCVPKFMVSQKLMTPADGFKVIEYGDENDIYMERSFGAIVDKFWTRDTGIMMMPAFINSTSAMTESILRDKAFLMNLKNVDADLFVLTHHPLLRGLNVLPYVLEKKFALLGPFYDPHLFRIPHSPAATHMVFNDVFKLKGMTFLERLRNALIQMAVFSRFMFLSVDGYVDMVRETIPNDDIAYISYQDLVMKSEIFLIEADHILDYPKPTLPNTILIGGTAATEAKELKEPFKSFVDGAKDGLILVTFGSAIIDIPDQRVLSTMLGAFLKFKQRVVYRGNVPSPDPSKVLIAKWVPQNDILAHNNTVLFVSHCGANGNYESLYHGVPVLCLPFFLDQFFNAERTTERGFGLKADIRDLTEQQWLQLVSELVDNPSYKYTMKKASALYRELYHTPVEKAAFWLDHVIQHGGSYMRSAGQEMEMYQYLMWDVASFLVLTVGMVVWVLYKLCCCCCCRCCLRLSKSEKSKRE